MILSKERKKDNLKKKKNFDMSEYKSTLVLFHGLGLELLLLWHYRWAQSLE